MKAHGSLLVVLLSILAGCGTDETAGRPAGDQTENGIRASVVDGSGAPVVGARVVAHPATWLQQDSFLPSHAASWVASTDSFGHVLLPLPAGRWQIEIIGSGRRAQFGATVDEGILDVGSRRIDPTGSIEGIAPAPGSWIGVRGLGHGARADASGRFRMDSLPAGVVELVASDASHAWSVVGSGTESDCGILRTDSVQQVLLDDFEDGDPRHWWAPLAGGGWWYAVASDSVAASPTGLLAEAWKGIQRDSATGARLFHARFEFDSTETNPWAEIGVQLAPSTSTSANLSALESVSFRIRGSGSVAIRFDSRLAGRLVAHLDLPDTWREIRVPLDSFRLEKADSTTTRRQFLAAATGMAWEFLASGEILLDDIRLRGPTPQTTWSANTPP